jgi:hypothetical protein
MRALGDRSVASVLKRVLDVLYFLAFLPPALVLVGGAIVVSVDSEHLTTHPHAKLQFRPDEREIRVPGEGLRRFAIREARAVFEVEGVPKARFLFGLGWALLEALLLLYLLRQLRAVFGTLKAADPFVPENAARIRDVGLTLLALELSTHAYLFASYFLFVAGRVAIPDVGLSPRFEPSILALAGGVALLLVAEVFRIGARLREEAQLTV